MIADWRTYSVEDFIPFTPDVYFRLIERANDALWPLHLLLLVIGGVIVFFQVSGWGRASGALLAVTWFWVGGAFLIQRYAELIWVGAYFGWGFWLNGVVLVGCGVAGRFARQKTGLRALTGPEWLGFALMVFGLVVYPILGPILGGGWAQSESFGIHPDPTAITTLGILLMAARGWSLWIASLVPILWCMISGLTLWALEASWAIGLPVVAMVTIAGMFWKTFRRKKS